MTRIVLVALLTIAVSCAPPSGGTSTGNPMVDLKFASFSPTMKIQAESVGTFALTNLKFCFKRLRFKQAGETTSADPSVDGDNIDFYLGEVNVSTLGTNLGSIALPAGSTRGSSSTSKAIALPDEALR